MQQGRGRSAEAGFTLIEAMISMFFIAFIVGEMVMVNVQAKRSSVFARRVTEANMIAEGVLEKARNTAYTNLNLRFSALNTPANPIMFDLNRDGLMESYSESCPLTPPTGAPPAPSGTPVGATLCGAYTGIYGIYRAVYPAFPAGSTFAASTGAGIDVYVRWYDAKQQLQEVRVSTVRSKF